MGSEASRLTIPPRNLFYIFCYAWELYEEGESIAAEAEPYRRIHNFLGSVLIRAVGKLVKRGLYREYRKTSGSLPFIRGRVDMLKTYRRSRGVIASVDCEWEELALDCEANRILKCALRFITIHHEFHPRIREGARMLLPYFAGVGETAGRLHLSRTRLNRNSKAYRLPLLLCNLLFRSANIRGGGESIRFRDADILIRQSRIFEKFVFEFYRREMPSFKVSRDRLFWKPHRGEADALLPTMLTDVSMRERSGRRGILIEVKFYRNPFTENLGISRHWSNHLYQLRTYLEAVRKTDSAFRSWEGLLLYARAGESFSYNYELLGVPVRVAGIDLSRKWGDVFRTMIGLVEPGAVISP